MISGGNIDNGGMNDEDRQAVQDMQRDADAMVASAMAIVELTKQIGEWGKELTAEDVQKAAGGFMCFSNILSRISAEAHFSATVVKERREKRQKEAVDGE